ncbi:hypothetical protein LO772_12755 [Yinghuangia sp. ASG 101]|uniref:hypothetical protein n=1 Tax=Yinghuangia sp. ASG 101 TaxID=2896848 RepID=UPI001E2E1A38|nr:hypothetical protein [Yinghuangia sp. ASG 101]UGQ14374.1 hypothetical protein LO772_12755 [Yinghuangia sp. ASG 101]
MVISGMDHSSRPRRVPIPAVDAMRGGTGERLERHVALLGHVQASASAPEASGVAARESASIIQELAPRTARPNHRLARAVLTAPLRGLRRRIAI